MMVQQSGNVYGGNRNSSNAGRMYFRVATGETTQGSFMRTILQYYSNTYLLLCLFANFAEAIAEARGKAQADSLRKTREETPAKKVLPVGEMFVR